MRAMPWAFAIGITLVLTGLAVSTMAPGAGGEIVVVAGACVLGAIAVVALVRAAHTPGSTRAWNPGSARREYRAEQAAKQPGHAKDQPER